MEHRIKHLLQRLSRAASQVTDEYLQLLVTDSDAVYREKVYGYELYYQLRCLWDAFPFNLGGEVDKAGHPHFRFGVNVGRARSRTEWAEKARLLKDPGY